MLNADAREESPGTPQVQPEASGAETNGGTPPAQPEASPDEGLHAVSSTREYQFGEGENAFSISGEEMRNLVGRGALAQRLQSQADSATARNSELETALSGSQEENEELRQVIAQTNQREQIAQSIKEQLPAASQQPPQASGAEWYTGEEGAPQKPVPDYDKIAQQIGDIAEQTVQEATQENFGNVEELVANVVAKVMEQQNTQRITQENANKWASDRHDARVDRYIETYGFSEQDASNIAKLFDTAQLHENLGSTAAQQGNGDLAAQHYDEHTRLTTAGTEEIAKQIVKHDEQQRRADLEAQVESGQFDGLPKEVDDSVDLTAPNKFWKEEGRRDLKKWRETLRDRGAAKMEQFNLARQALSAETESVRTR